MSLRKTLLKEACEWIVASTGVDRERVRLSQRGTPATRPSISYLEVSFLAFDLQVGEPEHIIIADNIAGPFRDVRIAHRSATLSVRAYGPESSDWLVTLGLFTPCVDYSFSVNRDLGILDLSGMGDSTSGVVHDIVEHQYVRDFEISYIVKTEFEPSSVNCAEEVILTGTYDLTVDLDP